MSFAQFFIGSVAEFVVRHAVVPLWTVRAPAKEAEKPAQP